MKNDKAADYDEDYYFGRGYYDAEAIRLWKKDKGKTLSPNMKQILDFGDVKAGEMVLDLGCGFGQIALHCALRGCKTVAIDSSNSAIRLSRETFRAHTVHATLMKRKCWDLPFDDASFDVVYLVAVAWHLPERDLMRTLSQIRRILKPGGRLIANTCGNPWTETFGYPLLWAYKKIRGRPFFPECEESGHVNRMNPLSFRRVLERVGFSVELRVGFNPSERIRRLHKVVLQTPLKYLLCRSIVAVCTKPK